MEILHNNNHQDHHKQKSRKQEQAGRTKRKTPKTTDIRNSQLLHLLLQQQTPIHNSQKHKNQTRQDQVQSQTHFNHNNNSNPQPLQTSMLQKPKVSDYVESLLADVFQVQIQKNQIGPYSNKVQIQLYLEDENLTFWNELVQQVKEIHNQLGISTKKYCHNILMDPVKFC